MKMHPTSSKTQLAALFAGLWVGLSGLLMSLPATAQVPERILVDQMAVVVNSRGYTVREVALRQEMLAQRLRESYQGAELDQALAQIRNQLLSEMVNDLLLEDQAEALGLVPAQDQVTQQVQAIVARQPTLLATYSESELMTLMARQIQTQMLVQQVINPRLRVTAQQVEAACEVEAGARVERDIGHILLRGMDDTVRQKLLQLRERLLAGENFEALAQQYSEDPSARSNRGRLGFVGPGRFVEAFDKAAFALPLNTISEPVLTEFGYHLIVVFQERLQEGQDCTALGEADYNNYYNRLMQTAQQTLLEEYLLQLREKAYITVFNR